MLITTPPTIQNHMQYFMDIVTYYMYMCVRRSSLLHPLTAFTSTKVKFKWIDVEQKAFYDIKRSVAYDTLLAYPVNKRFDIHTDSRN